MSALAPLFVAVLLLLLGQGALPVAAAVVAAAVSGTTLPDMDLALGLGHRSALLHSVLPVALAASDRRTWPLAAGLGLGIGLHLSADLFPATMRGYATVKLPLFGSIGAGASYLWIAANAALALATGAWLLGQVTPPRVAAWTLVTVGAVGVAYLIRTDGGWWALALFAGLAWAAMRLGLG